jgi:hypothetical protein
MTHSTHTKLPFGPEWFWDFDYNKMDWQASYKTVIARIIERGGEQEWQGLVQFYGQDKVINALKKEITYLADYAIDEASNYFSIPKEQMLCYIRKQSKPRHWI